MATTWNFYSDPGLTTLAAGGATVVQAGAPVDRVLYFGSPVASKQLRAASNPGTDAITITPTDAAASSGAPASAIKLSLSFAGLAGATGGAALPVGTVLNSGAGGAVAVYVRTTPGALGLGTYGDISLQTNDVVES